MSTIPRPVFQIKVTLRDADPPIWRRVLVSCDTKLTRLHDIIQAAMGWQHSHLYLFTVGIVCFATGADPDNLTELAAVDARYVRLEHLVRPHHPYPRHPQHKRNKVWIGRSLDPEAFSVEETNLRLGRIRAV